MSQNKEIIQVPFTHKLLCTECSLGDTHTPSLELALCVQTSALDVKVLIRSCSLTSTHTQTYPTYTQSVSYPVALLSLHTRTHARNAQTLTRLHVTRAFLLSHTNFSHSHTHALSDRHVQVVFVLKLYGNPSRPQRCLLSEVMATLLV